jgi:hypothetical protein
MLMHSPHSRRPGTRDTAAARPRSTSTLTAARRAAVIIGFTFLFAVGALAAYANPSNGGCKGKKICSSSTGSTSSTAASTSSTAASTTESTTSTTDTQSQASATSTNSTTTTSAATSSATNGGRHILAYYYLWWSSKHWHDKLGSSYPYTQSPLPLPATLDSIGCNPVSLYVGNQLSDVPETLWSQDDPGVIENDVRTAAKAGLAGFIVNWAGTGTVDQTTTSVGYSRRLDAVFAAVHKVNAEGIPFKIWISYKVAASPLPSVGYIANDLAYLVRQYGNDPAYDHSYSSRPILLWTGSRKYSASAVKTISDLFRSAFFIVGDESLATWTDGRSASLDGDSYYWSSQNPYTNPGSFTTLQKLAATVRSSGSNPDGSKKLWFAPFTPGYDSILLGGSTCVPRYGTDTLDRLFAGNAQSSPDGWTLISWNEIAEGTYVLPLQRWGSAYLDELRVLATG